MDTILEVKHLCKSFIGVKALKDVSLSIRQGEIHCLAGENGCGKSTLVKNIAGVYTPDSGEILLNGHSYRSLTPVQAMQEGVQVIYQDLSLFQHMTVAENIALAKLKFEKNRFIHWNQVYKIAQEQLDKIGVTIDLNQTVGEISIANRQITAICRALAQDAKILFMDEPTTALTNKEVSQLLKIITDLKEKGLAVIFISHKLDEIFSVADTITIFRNGEKIGSFASSQLDKKKLSYYMTGREVEYPRYHRTVKNDTPILKADNLTKAGQYSNLSFSVRPGDIIGLTGLLGSGRTELAMSLFGLNPPQSGSVTIGEQKVSITSPGMAKKYGIALLPEDRFTQGLFMDRDIKENLTSSLIDNLTKRGILDKKEEKKIAEDSVEQLNVRTPSINTVIGTLSGGNQQKVVIGKWLATHPKLFIMDTPTVGIDIGSKAEIYQQIQAFASGGMSILFISDEIQEILANCNRVMVLSEGNCVKILEEEELAQENAAQILSELIGHHSSAGKEETQ